MWGSGFVGLGAFSKHGGGKEGRNCPILRDYGSRGACKCRTGCNSCGKETESPFRIRRLPTTVQLDELRVMPGAFSWEYLDGAMAPRFQVVTQVAVVRIQFFLIRAAPQINLHCPMNTMLN